MSSRALDFDHVMTWVSEKVVERMTAAVPVDLPFKVEEALRFWLADNVLEEMTVADTRDLIAKLERDR